eukprot:scaffold8826_cov117-Isochrysis_galbana.AAC.2
MAFLLTAILSGVPPQSFDALFSPPNLLSLEGRCALVTGASAGIGRATACALALQGMDLVLVARRKDRLLELKAEIERRGLPGRVTVVAGDVTADSLYDELRNLGCVVDTLINNAGLARGVSRVGKAAETDWKEMLDANCYGAFRMVNEVRSPPFEHNGLGPFCVQRTPVLARRRASLAQMLPQMLARGSGHVVSLGSIAGLEPYEGGAVYAASKHAMHAFCKALRYETYDSNIRCTVVAPGLVGEGTEFSEVRLRDGDKAKEVYDGMAELKATDLANSIVWVLRQPPHVNVDMLHVMPTCQGGSGRIHRSQLQRVLPAGEPEDE